VLSGVAAGSVTISVQADLRSLAVLAPDTGKKGRGESTIIRDMGGDLLADAIAKDAADAARETASGSTVPEDDDGDPGAWHPPGGTDTP